MTHVDAYSLERARFGGTMLQFPSAAMHLADVIATTRSKETPAEKHDKKRRSVKLPPERAGLAATPTAEPHGSFDERGASTSIDALREAIDQASALRSSRADEDEAGARSRRGTHRPPMPPAAAPPDTPPLAHALHRTATPVSGNC